MMIKAFLLKRYAGNSQCKIWRDELANACNSFVKSGWADANFTNELCSGLEQKFWSRVSEALLSARLCKVGLHPQPSHGGGPDFLLIEKGRKIWIEVICPEPAGVPSDWLTYQAGKRERWVWVDFPHEHILLRWTSAIKEKAEKLIGSSDGKVKGYLEKGIVESGDAYVIAVNGCQLRNGPFPALLGISQLPFAAEAVFAIGPYQIKINRDTLEQTGAGHQHRPFIFKPNGSQVPAYTFLDARFKPISAIWAVDVAGTLIGNINPMAVIHNPNAYNPIPIGFLPAHDEYVATPIGSEMFELKKW
jgi:type I restriction enzyme S subunit